MPSRPAHPRISRDRRDSTALQLAAAALRRRAFHTERHNALCPAETLGFADVLDAAARDIESLGLRLRSSLLEVATAIQQNPFEDPTAPG
jgi:hypothetical protein